MGGGGIATLRDIIIEGWHGWLRSWTKADGLYEMLLIGNMKVVSECVCFL